MLKKIIALVGAGTVFLTLARPAFAYKNVAVIRNNIISAIANTGENIQSNNIMSMGEAMLYGFGISGNNTITTGDAKAKAKLYIRANDNWDYEEYDEGGENDLAVVKENGINVYADTGLNVQFNDVIVENTMMDNVGVSIENNMITGKAKAKAKAWIVVNSSWLY